MTTIYNIAKMTSSTIGTGTFTLVAAVPGFLTFVQSGVPDGAVVPYSAREGANTEFGTGTVGASGTTLTRSVTKSTNADALVSFSGAVEVAITPRAEDMVNKTGDTMTGALVVPNASGLKIKDTDASHTLGIVGGSNLTSDRTLTLTTGDANRVLDISAGNVTISAAGAALIDDADEAAQRASLALGTAAVATIGVSGDTVPKNNTANIFSATQTVNKNASSFPSGLTSGALDVMAADATATLLNIVSFGANSNFTQSRAGGTAASMSAISSGDLIGQNVFKGYDGTAWGSNQVVIRSYATENWSSSAHGSDLRFGTTSNGATTVTDRCRVDQDGTFRPAADNTYNLGNASYRWKEVFAGTGSINTSDARHKTDVRELSADEIAAAKALVKEIGAYQFLDSVAKKGSGNARLHIGMTVQRVMQIMQNYGLEPTRYGFVCFDAWAHEKQEYEAVIDSEGNIVEPAYVYERQAGDLYGFRTDQLLMFIARGFEARLSALENHLFRNQGN